MSNLLLFSCLLSCGPIYKLHKLCMSLVKVMMNGGGGGGGKGALPIEKLCRSLTTRFVEVEYIYKMQKFSTKLLFLSHHFSFFIPFFLISLVILPILFYLFNSSFLNRKRSHPFINSLVSTNNQFLRSKYILHINYH